LPWKMMCSGTRMCCVPSMDSSMGDGCGWGGGFKCET
jgi:hypothetical protein